MNSKRKILSLEHYFKNNENGEMIAIPKLDFYENTSTAILLLDKIDFLMNNNIQNILMDKKAILSYFSSLKNNENNDQFDIEMNKKEILKHIVFMDLKTVNNQKSDIPFVSKYLDILQQNENNLKSITKIQKMISKYSFVFKKILFNAIEDDVLLLKKHFSNFNEEQDRFINEYEQLSKKNDELELLELMAAYQDTGQKIFTLLVNDVFNIFKSVYDKFDFFQKQTFENLDFLGDENIVNLQKELFWLEKIKTSGKEAIITELKLRDLNIKKSEIAKYLNNSILASYKKWNFLLNWYKEAYKIDKKRTLNFPKNTPQYKHLVKTYLMKKFIYLKLRQIDKKSFFSITDLKTLDELRRDLDLQSKLFISNNLAPTMFVNDENIEMKVKKIIWKEFYFNFDNYFNSSDDLIYQSKDLIKNIKKEISETHKHKKNFVSNDGFELKILQIKDQIIDLKSEYAWQNEKIKSRYLETIKNGSNILNSIEEFSKNYKKITSKYLNLKNKFEKDRLQGKFKNFEPSNLKQLSENHYKTATYFNSFNFLFTNLLLIKNLIVQKNELSTQQLIGIDKLLKFTGIFNNSSIEIENLIIDTETISYADRLKINFLFALNKNPRFIFITDDPSNKENKAKIDFLKTVKNTCEEQKVNFVFITDNKNLLKEEYFENLYVFIDQKEIEYGKLTNVLKNPINPWLSKNQLQNKDILLKFFNDEYVFHDIYEIDNAHFVVGTPSNISSWDNPILKNNIQNLTFILNEDSQEHTIEFKILDLSSPFGEIEFFILDKFKKVQNQENTNLFTITNELTDKYKELYYQQNLEVPNFETLNEEAF